MPTASCACQGRFPLQPYRSETKRILFHPCRYLCVTIHETIDFSHNDVKCGFKMLHETGLALKNVEPIIFKVA